MILPGWPPSARALCPDPDDPPSRSVRLCMPHSDEVGATMGAGCGQGEDVSQNRRTETTPEGDPCTHGVPGGCEVRCACGHLCRRHDAVGCQVEGDAAAETLLTAILGPVEVVACDCAGFDAAGGEG